MKHESTFLQQKQLVTLHKHTLQGTLGLPHHEIRKSFL